MRGHKLRIHHSKIDPVSRKRPILINICTINLKSTVSTQECSICKLILLVAWINKLLRDVYTTGSPRSLFHKALRRPLESVPCHLMLTLQVLLRHRSFSACQVSRQLGREPLISIYSSTAFVRTSAK